MHGCSSVVCYRHRPLPRDGPSFKGVLKVVCVYVCVCVCVCVCVIVCDLETSTMRCCSSELGSRGAVEENIE